MDTGVSVKTRPRNMYAMPFASTSSIERELLPTSPLVSAPPVCETTLPSSHLALGPALIAVRTSSRTPNTRATATEARIAVCEDQGKLYR